jgi:hypothetical protein
MFYRTSLDEGNQGRASSRMISLNLELERISWTQELELLNQTSMKLIPMISFENVDNTSF